ncbi:hypothetical protein K2Z84_32075 [Candidatus Binatia bacterium]|nr:hypothetical protein [Candidatus Binatia bacterium]
MREEQLLKLVATIHESVLAIDGWHGFARELEETISGTTLSFLMPTRAGDTVLQAVQRDALDVDISLQWYAPSLDAEFISSMLARFRFESENPFVAPDVITPGTDVRQTNEIVSLDLVKKSTLYNEWMRPQDLALGPNLVGYLYADGAPDIPALHLFRHRGRRPYGASERRALSLLLPHIRQATSARFELAAVREEKRALEDVIDRLTIGIILIDARGRIAHANRSALEVLRTRAGLEEHRGELRALDPGRTRKLQELVQQAVRTGAGEGIGAGAPIALPRPGQRDLVALVTPLRIPRPFYYGRAPLAAVFLTGVLMDDLAVDQILRAIFGLTPRESALAREIAAGRTIEEAAARFGREVSTERSRLKEVFAKVGVTRQAELVHAVLSFSAVGRNDSI